MAEISRLYVLVCQHTNVLLSYPNVIGVGAARKVRRGRASDEHSVVTYVSRKLPLEFLEPHERIPRQFEIDDDTVPSDVVEIAEPRFLAVDTKRYPTTAGWLPDPDDIWHGDARSNLLRQADQQPVLLTNNHVLTTAGSPTFLPSDTPVLAAGGWPARGQH